MRVLIVDDYAPVADSLAALLADDGVTVDTRYSYADGLAVAERYDVVVSDRDLGDGDGVELLAALRERELAGRYVLFSAGLTTREAQALEAAGAADVVLVKGLDTSARLLEIVGLEQ